MLSLQRVWTRSPLCERVGSRQSIVVSTIPEVSGVEAYAHIEAGPVSGFAECPRFGAAVSSLSDKLAHLPEHAPAQVGHLGIKAPLGSVAMQPKLL